MLIHGGDTAGFLEVYGKEPLDFSANVSPLGLPSAVASAVIESLSQADRYPDPLCRMLRDSIGETEGVSPDWALCGNGAADLIYRLAVAKKPKIALMPAPTFAEYALALEQVDCAIAWHNLKEEDGFAITDSILPQITKQVDMVFICQPNNPTGTLCSRDLLDSILDRCEQTDTLLVLDACFSDFLDDANQHTLHHRLGSPNLLMLKAFTKLYAMAGLRLGYCLSSNEELLAAMDRAGQPWSVSCVAQAAGIAALKQHDYVAELKSLLAVQRPFLAEGLSKLGLRVFHPSVNFIFFKAPAHLGSRLGTLGILIRSCENYPNLEGGYYRVAVRTESENCRLLQAVEEALSWQNP